MTERFYLFRHGETTWNASGHTQGRTDESVLTEKGKTQAARVGELLKGKGLEAIITSPLARTRQTAEIVMGILGVPVHPDAAFIEQDVGEIQGMHKDELAARDGDLWRRWRSNAPENRDAAYPGSETKRQAWVRVLAGLERYAADSSFGTLGISCHGFALDLSLLSFADAESSDFLKKTEGVPNASIVVLRRDSSGFVFEGFTAK